MDEDREGPVLRGLTREQLADHPLTREYLEAGRDLVSKALETGTQDGEAHPFLRWLSRPAVISAVAARGEYRGSDGTFRDRWVRHGDYVSDLVAWIRARRRENPFPVRAEEVVRGALNSSAQPSVVIRILARRGVLGVFENPLFRFQLLALAVTGSRRAARAAADEAETDSDVYDEVDAAWQPVVTAFLDTQNLSLRPGVEVADLIEILVAVGEGLALRELAEPTSGVLRERRASLQGLTALALLLACTGTDANTVDEVLDEYLQHETPER